MTQSLRATVVEGREMVLDEMFVGDQMKTLNLHMTFIKKGIF